MVRKERVLYVVHRFLPESIDGPELHVLWLADELKFKYEAFVFTRTSEPSLSEGGIGDDVFQGIKVRRVKVSGKYRAAPSDYYLNSSVADQFEDYLDLVKPSLVHIFTLSNLSASIVEVAAAREIPTVLTICAFYHMCFRVCLLDSELRLCDGPEDGRKCGKCISNDLLGRPQPNSPFYQQAGIDRTKYMQKLLLLPNIIISPNNFVKRKLVEFGIPATKIRVSPSGVDVTGIQRRQFKPKPMFVFGYLGHPLPYKGIDVLIDAFRRLDQTKAQLRMYGGSPEIVNEIRERLEGLNVQVTGRYSREQLPGILSGIDVAIVPSICHEGGPLVIDEAFAAGIPVIVSDAGAQAEYVLHNKNGLHFRTGDSTDLGMKMSLFIENPELVHKLSKYTPRVRTPTDEAHEFARIYKKLVYAKRTKNLQRLRTRLKTLRELRESILVRNLEYVRSQQQAELEAIRNSLGYKWTRFYGSKIDQLLPNGTRRGKFKQKMTTLIRAAAQS